MSQKNKVAETKKLFFEKKEEKSLVEIPEEIHRQKMHESIEILETER